MRILVAEDELPLAKALVKILQKNNYSADAVHNGREAINYLECDNYDCLILDIMMPVMDGYCVLRHLRAKGNNIPVIILSARSEVDDRVEGLDCGANYYLTKPFDTKELLASIRAVTRGQAVYDSKIKVGNITLDRATFELVGVLGSFKLANKEFQVMEMLMSNPHIIISSERFFEKIWGYDSDTDMSVVWVYISYLRKKLIALGATVCIRASRNAGYSLEELDDC